MKYTVDYLKIKDIIKNADAIIIGLGSGISAAGGLDYLSEEVFKELYPKFFDKGYKYIFDAISNNWVNSVTEDNAYDFWDFWTRHIYNVRYSQETLLPYKLLKEIVADKQHFVITTNGDGQSQKVFNDVYAPQGDYSLFQCKINCSNEVTNNEDYILKNLDDVKDIPRCKCGQLLIPNLRVDDYFCETFGQSNYEKYYDFVIKNKDKNLVLLEFGVGFNTPSIIRFPFDRMSQLPNVTLIRVNKTEPDVYDGYSIDDDITEFLFKIR